VNYYIIYSKFSPLAADTRLQLLVEIFHGTVDCFIR